MKLGEESNCGEFWLPCSRQMRCSVVPFCRSNVYEADNFWPTELIEISSIDCVLWDGKERGWQRSQGEEAAASCVMDRAESLLAAGRASSLGLSAARLVKGTTASFGAVVVFPSWGIAGRSCQFCHLQECLFLRLEGRCCCCHAGVLSLWSMSLSRMLLDVKRVPLVSVHGAVPNS